MCILRFFCFNYHGDTAHVEAIPDTIKNAKPQLETRLFLGSCLAAQEPFFATSHIKSKGGRIAVWAIRYWSGDIPTVFLKTRLKYFSSEYPTWAAI